MGRLYALEDGRYLVDPYDWSIDIGRVLEEQIAWLALHP